LGATFWTNDGADDVLEIALGKATTVCQGIGERIGLAGRFGQAVSPTTIVRDGGIGSAGEIMSVMLRATERIVPGQDSKRVVIHKRREERTEDGDHKKLCLRKVTQQVLEGCEPEDGDYGNDPISEELPKLIPMKQKGTVTAKATKSDDAPVPIHLWNNRILSAFPHLHQKREEAEKALDAIRLGGRASDGGRKSSWAFGNGTAKPRIGLKIKEPSEKQVLKLAWKLGRRHGGNGTGVWPHSFGVGPMIISERLVWRKSALVRGRTSDRKGEIETLQVEGGQGESQTEDRHCDPARLCCNSGG
jgi:hypothetical protein